MNHHIRLSLFKDKDISFYFRRGQIVSHGGKLFQHQVRFRDSFGIDLIGHYMVDERDFEVVMDDDSLTSFRTAIESISHHSG